MSNSVLYVAFTNVDDKTGVPVNEQPCTTAPSLPKVNGLVYDFALESQYPTPIPTLYGTVPEEAGLDWPGFIAVYTEDEYDAAKITEMETRVHLAKVSATQRVLQSFNEDVARLVGFRSPAETTATTVLWQLLDSYNAKLKTVNAALQVKADALGVDVAEFVKQSKEQRQEQTLSIMTLSAKCDTLLDKIKRAETAQAASAVHWFMEM